VRRAGWVGWLPSAYLVLVSLKEFMSAQNTSPGAGASGGALNTHTSTSPRISRYYPPHFQSQHHYPSQPLIGINPHSVMAPTIPITTSLPTAAINEGIIANCAINGALPVTLGMGSAGSKVSKSAATVGVASILASPSTAATSVSSILSASGAAQSGEISGSVSGSGGNASSIITGLPGLPYGIIMDPSDVNEVVGGGAEVILGRDSVITTEPANPDICSGGATGGGVNGVNGFYDVSGVNGHVIGAGEVEKEGRETDRNLTEECTSSRSSSVATIVYVSQNLTDMGESLPEDSRLSLLPEEDMHEEVPKSQLGAWKDLRLVYAIVRISTLPRRG